MNDINPRAGKLPRFAKVIFFVLGFALTAGSLYAAWSPPPSVTPPTCPSGDPGCDAPVNVGNTFQLKEGNLMVNYPVSGPEAVTGLNVNGDFLVPFGKVGIGTVVDPLYVLSIDSLANRKLKVGSPLPGYNAAIVAKGEAIFTDQGVAGASTALYLGAFGGVAQIFGIKDGVAYPPLSLNIGGA